MIAKEIWAAGGVAATSAAMSASAAWGRTANLSGAAEPQEAPAAVVHVSRGPGCWRSVTVACGVTPWLAGPRGDSPLAPVFKLNQYQLECRGWTDSDPLLALAQQRSIRPAFATHHRESHATWTQPFKRERCRGWIQLRAGHYVLQ